MVNAMAPAVVVAKRYTVNAGGGLATWSRIGCVSVQDDRYMRFLYICAEGRN